MTSGTSIAALPHALRDGDELTRSFGERRPAVFLDYDGTLTPIVDRPVDAVISQSMRVAVRGLMSARYRWRREVRHERAQLRIVGVELVSAADTD